MANNKSVAFFVLLLAFLFLLTAPIVLVAGYYFGILRLSGIVTAATAGLFLIPAFLVYLAAIVVAVKKRGLAVPSAAVAKAAVVRQAPARYAWEGVFGLEEGREEKRHEEKRRATSKPPAANFKAAAAVVVVIALVALVLLLANATKPAIVAGANKTGAANVTAADASSNVTGEKQSVLSRILARVFAARNATNEAQAVQDVGEKPADEVKPQQPQRNLSTVSLSGAAKKALGSVKSFGGKIKSGLVSSAGSLKSGILKVPDAVWQKIAVAAVALLAAVTLFYSHKAGQLGEIPKWFRDWLSWLLGIFSYAGKNKLKVMLWLVLAAVVCAAVAAVIFRGWLKVKLPALPAFSMSGVVASAVNALLAVRDFVSVYRLYILIGIFSLLAIIGILFIYENRGKKKEES
ncbi:hypothetical protein HYU20_00360 [Candidatus Woesearchaeota archaeon]|nr:hypothetical protein [Candidatus Woesearchaeota archaeon]